MKKIITLAIVLIMCAVTVGLCAATVHAKSKSEIEHEIALRQVVTQKNKIEMKYIQERFINLKMAIYQIDKEVKQLNKEMKKMGSKGKQTGEKSEANAESTQGGKVAPAPQGTVPNTHKSGTRSEPNAAEQ